MTTGATNIMAFLCQTYRHFYPKYGKWPWYGVVLVGNIQDVC